MQDTLNGREYDKLARAMRPSDYCDGRGLSPAGDKVRDLIAAADVRAEYEPKPEADDSWGSIRGDQNPGA